MTAVCSSDSLPLGGTTNGLGSCSFAITACPCLQPRGWSGRSIWPEWILHVLTSVWPEGHSKTSHFSGRRTTLSFFPCFSPVSPEDQIWVDSNVSRADFARSAAQSMFRSSCQMITSLTFPEPVTYMTTSFFVVSRDRYSVQSVMLSYFLDSSTIFWNIVLFLWEEKEKKKLQNKEAYVL